LQGASVPEGALSLAHWNPVLLQRRVSDLEVANAGQCSFASFFGYLINLFLAEHPCLTVFHRYDPTVF
jgi:hypothetical protein